MTYLGIDTIVARGSSLALGQPMSPEIRTRPVLVHSLPGSSEPTGFLLGTFFNAEAPVSKNLRHAPPLDEPTGFLLGDLVSVQPAGAMALAAAVRSAEIEPMTELEQAAAASFRYIQKVVTALPRNDDDERSVEELYQRATSHLKTRPLRRRDGSPR